MKEKKVPYEFRQRKVKKYNRRKIKIGNIDISQWYCPVTITIPV